MSWANQGMSKFLLGLFAHNQVFPQLTGKKYLSLICWAWLPSTSLMIILLWSLL